MFLKIDYLSKTGNFLEIYTCAFVCVYIHIYTHRYNTHICIIYIIYVCDHVVCMIYLPDNLIRNTEKERKLSIYLYIIFPDNF